MAKKLGGLGRGLDSLFADNSVDELNPSVNKLRIMEIEPNRDQPRKDFDEKSLSELAERLHYDIHWLSREIKRKTGMTFTELLQEKRLLQTEYLLTNSNIPVGDIAASVGYNNTNYFHSIFKSRFGVSPKKHRDAIRQKNNAV